ncbi:PPE domain-containing protein [Nocardia sp. BMG111209]|uniref:PPE domain-containing protein n=1 Tax=Nocardia sp. BMG111209 TaxID=1160137 RepID=UPI000360BD01|nr:PPE domain-containing protein [Nocardia sp. BMG111209]
MIEPPFAGFTGVVWEARPTDRLARDLTTGPGSVPAAEAAVAWGHLAAGFGAAVVEYDRILGEIRDHWHSDTSDEVLERISTMREWLLDAAGAAGRNAVHAGDLATAYEVARLAMPHIGEIAALAAAAQGMAAAAAALGAPLIGAAAQIGADQDIAGASAARVMRSYESAAEPLSRPWSQTEPPTLSTEVALAAEQAVPARPPTTTEAPPIMVPLPAFPVPEALVGARVRRVAVVSREPAPVRSPAAPVATTTGQSAPAAAASPTAGAAEEERTVRAGPAESGYGSWQFESGLAAAPAVVGEHDAPPTGSASSGAAG